MSLQDKFDTATPPSTTSRPVRRPRAPRKQTAPRATLPTISTHLKNPELYSNRELSWLQFNQRVLAQATDDAHPLLERINFLAIAANNLDEFLMIRVATTLKKLREGLNDVGADGYDTDAQLTSMWARSVDMMADQAACWSQLREALAGEGITFVEPPDWSDEARAHLERYFDDEILPALTPLAFDPGHPFPLISNLSKNFAVVVRHAGHTRFARVKVPDVLPRFIPIPAPGATGCTFAFLEDVIRANVHHLFPGTVIKGTYLFRVVRDADLAIEQDDADDLLETIDRGLSQLPHGAIALLHVEAAMPDRVLKTLADNFEVDSERIVRSVDRLGLADWSELTSIARPALRYPPLVQRTLWREGEVPEVIFDQIRQRDLIVHHPFDSFGAVEAFLGAAATDPLVIDIKMTLYRIGAEPPLVDLLIQAAKLGKQVTVLVELKARFDERANIEWAKQLEAHHIHVIYGLANLKTHSKLCLVVRKEADGIRRYVHLGTGNYNPETCRLYTDIGLFTCDKELAADVGGVFNYLTGYSNAKQFGRLLVAPVDLRSRLDMLLKREAEHARQGQPARVVIKVNSLTDDQMVRAFYRASQAGVSIDLIVRGPCCLRPGVPGVSDRITVRSIIGRFLEHSRIFWFLNGGDDELFIGSADMMERNLDRRVETLTPIANATLRTHLRDVVLGTYLRDDIRAWRLDASRTYQRPDSHAGHADAQGVLLAHYADTEP